MRAAAMVFTAVSTTALPVAARADTRTAIPQDGDAPFAFLDRFDHTSRIGLALSPSFSAPEYVPSDLSYAETRIDLYAHLFDAGSGLGAYAQLAMSVGATDTLMSGPGSWRAPIDVGAGYLRAINCVNTIILHAGVYIPLGLAEDVGLHEVAYVSRYARPTDASAFFLIPFWTLRAAISWVYEREAFAARVDAGVDVPKARPDGRNASSMSHINAGFGYAFPHASITAELSTLQGTAGGDDTHSLGPEDFPGRVFVGMSATLRASRVRPSVAILYRIGDFGSTWGSSREANLFVTIGVDVVLPPLR